MTRAEAQRRISLRCLVNARTPGEILRCAQNDSPFVAACTGLRCADDCEFCHGRIEDYEHSRSECRQLQPEISNHCHGSRTASVRIKMCACSAARWSASAPKPLSPCRRDDGPKQKLTASLKDISAALDFIVRWLGLGRIRRYMKFRASRTFTRSAIAWSMAAKNSRIPC